MPSFLTEFPTVATKGYEAFFELGKRWIAGNQHSSLRGYVNALEFGSADSDEAIADGEGAERLTFRRLLM